MSTRKCLSFLSLGALFIATLTLSACGGGGGSPSSSASSPTPADPATPPVPVPPKTTLLFTVPDTKLTAIAADLGSDGVVVGGTKGNALRYVKAGADGKSKYDFTRPVAATQEQSLGGIIVSSNGTLIAVENTLDHQFNPAKQFFTTSRFDSSNNPIAIGGGLGRGSFIARDDADVIYFHSSSAPGVDEISKWSFSYPPPISRAFTSLCGITRASKGIYAIRQAFPDVYEVRRDTLDSSTPPPENHGENWAFINNLMRPTVIVEDAAASQVIIFYTPTAANTSPKVKSGALIEPTSFQPSATIPKKLPDDYVALNGVSAGGGIAFVTFKTDHGTVIAKVSIADAKILAEKSAPGEKFALNAGKLFFISDSDSTQVHILDAGTIQ